MVPEIKGDVIYITTEERAKNWEWEKDAEKIDKRVQFVSVEDIELIRKKGEIRVPEKCLMDDVLIKHPYYTNKYMLLTDVENLRYDKFVKICEIAQLLGASSYQVKSTENKEEKRSLSASGEICYKISSEVNGTSKKELNQMYNVGVDHIFRGNEKVSLDAYNKAKLKAKEYNLDEDDVVRMLLNGRNPQIGNPQRKYRVCCNLTKEENSALDIAFSIKFIPNAFSFKSQVKSIIEKRVTISLEMTIMFPDNEV